MSITNVPSAVFLDHIVPHLEVKEIGSLSMVSKDLKEFCDDNLVWREMYLRTIRCVVVDNSVHSTFDNPLVRMRDTISSTFGIMTDIVDDDGTLLSYCLGRRWRGGRCLPNDVRLKIPRINPARVNGFRDDLSENAKTLLLEERMKYSEVIHGIWQEHNRGHEFGSSTVNLCRCAGHYQFNTLAVPASCKNSKSYKTTVLSKMRTQAKNPLTSLNAKILRHQSEIQRLHVLLRSSSEFAYTERMREYLKCFIAKEAELKASHATKSHLYNNLDDAITSMKECVMREKEAKKAIRMAKKKENEEKKAARLAKKEAKKSNKQ
jgi:hypothetical protein